MTNGPPKHRYLTFFGHLQPPQTTNLRVAVCQMVNEGATELTILFASDGGSTHDGIALFTYLTAQPLKVTMHAVGAFGSEGGVAALGQALKPRADVRNAALNAYTKSAENYDRADLPLIPTFDLNVPVRWTEHVGGVEVGLKVFGTRRASVSSPRMWKASSLTWCKPPSTKMAPRASTTSALSPPPSRRCRTQGGQR